MENIVAQGGQQGRLEMQKILLDQNFLEFDLSMRSIMHVDLTITGANEMGDAQKTQIGYLRMPLMLSLETQNQRQPR